VDCGILTIEMGSSILSKTLIRRVVYMKLYKINRILIVFIVMFSILCCNGNKEQKLIANKISSEKYKCENGEYITATYYILSDKSLEFVKLILPDNKEYTLPHSISASGVRYTDDFEYIWWTKGENAFLQARDQNGQWYIKYNNCKIIRNN
jgi:membrane-bound inhibitor of C-type lysozyme